MKLGEVRKLASEQLYILNRKREELTNILEEKESANHLGSNFDRFEIRKELSAIDEEYELLKSVSEKLSVLDANIQNAEIARQNSEAQEEAAEEMLKILEVFRRISKGDRVPAVDEKKLMEYSVELYMAAKNMALMIQNDKKENHKSLWEEDSSEEQPQDPAELAANTEVGNPIPQIQPGNESEEHDLTTNCL